MSDCSTGKSFVDCDWYRSGKRLYCNNCNKYRRVNPQKVAQEIADAKKEAQQNRDKVQVRIALALERIANNLQQMKRGLEHSYQKPFDVYVSMDRDEE